jgi:ABC-2 type transport system permease protein
MNGALFWTLVRNEMDMFKWRGSKHIKKIAIGCFVLLLAGGVLLWKALYGEPIVDKLINLSPVFHAFGFVAFALSLASINREWKEGTFYWWMSLPYSRWSMLWAKLVGVMLTFLRILLYFYIVVKVLVALVLYYGDAGHFTALFKHSLMVDGKALLQVISFAFTLSAIGFFISCLEFSRFRPYAFVGWIVYGLSFSFLHDQLFLIGSLGIFIGKILSGVLTMMVNALLLNRYMEAK